MDIEKKLVERVIYNMLRIMGGSYRCPKCNHIFIPLSPTIDEIHKLYKELKVLVDKENNNE